MSETNGNKITAVPGNIEFVYVDPDGQDKTILVDVVEAKLMADQVEKEINGLSDQLDGLKKWANTFGHFLTTSQAYQLRLGIEAGWEAFKKKLPPSLASLITTNSTRQPSTDIPSQPSRETSPNYSPKTNSTNEESKEDLPASTPTT